ncbi:heterogeneous nuclear ribonucleoprotein L isoform X1 [Hyalella azteca]|uniref:Heterogeneous nuclear ribonucleoprotein L isoform X1 n=1 Tax=Hyalella azteca TaxID=294128 RepID=A0A8B7PMB6_HYAAZ|nr:heterogeneous nuclear ribonucleoprotein L isoform X1 [Hyalella azteca]
MDHRRKGEPEQPNHVILMTIINPAYPITVDVIHTITQPHGNVLRIVIFKKNGVQCMVEFENVESATRAREALHGADIYAGCCTLRVEYAKPAKLNVYRNDSESWDYTNAGEQTMEHKGQPSGGSARPPLLQEPRFGGGLNGQMGGPPRSSGLFNSPGGMPDRYGGGGGGGGGGGMDLDSWDDRRGGGRDRRFNSRYNSNGMNNGGQRGGGVGSAGLAGAAPFMGGSGGPPNTMSPMGGPSPGLPQQGAVLMVYSLNKDRMNADKLFNLLCLYGNVVRIKFLKTKEGCAMVQMGDALAVERAIGNLNNTSFFGSKMQLGYSKQAFLADMQTPFDLPDGTPSFKDYMGNKNNRFINPEQASKNRIQPPSKILHFFNTPPNITESAMKEVFTEEDVAAPKAMKLFQSKSESERSSSGLLEFEDLQEALEALVSCNHARIPNPTGTRFPFIMKLCFSSSRSLQYKSDRSDKKEDEEDKWME